MKYLIIIIFGFIQGVTEFLPISSSGHLVILHKIFNLPMSEMSFDVILHLASLCAVFIFFKKDIFEIIKGVFLKNTNGKIGWLIILGTLPAAFLGYFFEDYIENTLRSIWFVAFMLVFVGVLFIIIEKIAKNSRDITDFKINDALFIGFAQALALIPGTSRSGVTVIAGMRAGFKREVAVKLSFLLSVPIILGANVKKITDINWSAISQFETVALFLGFFSGFLTSYFAIKFFISYSSKHTLNIFAYYRFILAFVLVCLLLLTSFFS